MVNNTKRSTSNAENVPPVLLNAKLLALTASTRSNIGASQRRKSRANAAAAAASSSKTLKMKRGAAAAKPRATVRFNVTPLPKSVLGADVEMKDAAPRPLPQPVPMNFPRELRRPEPQPISPAALASVDPELANVNAVFLREQLEDLGSELYQSLSSVKANPAKDKLPTEIDITVGDANAILPTHMLAIFGKEPTTPPSTSSSSASSSIPAATATATPTKPRKVTLFPVHSLVLAAHCAALPPFPPTLPAPTTRVAEQTTKVPIWPLCLPSPISYPALSTYLYTKRMDILFRSMLPVAPPAIEKDYRLIKPFAQRLAETFSATLLLKHTLLVHGLWLNMCALGVQDADMWDAVDLMWETLLVAMAISTGNPNALDEADKARLAAVKAERVAAAASSSSSTPAEESTKAASS